ETTSAGAPSRPELATVQPSAVRVTAICSLPTREPRTKTAKLSAPAPGGGGGGPAGGCARAGSGSASTAAAHAARVQSGKRIAQHSIMIQDAAFIDRTDTRGRIAVRGSDRGSYLQGLLTNDVASLEPGRGCYTAYLTAQGRMIADAYIYELGDLMLLSVAR